MQKKIILKIVSLIVLTIFVSGFAYAATSVPEKFVYEGRLLDSTGTTAITTEHTFRFSLWSASAIEAGDINAGVINVGAPNYGGWEEEHTITPNSDGFFGLELGTVVSLPQMDSTTHLYLQVEVKASGDPDLSYEILDRAPSDPLTDRASIGSVPYALNADSLDNADVGTSSGDIVLLGPSDAWPVSTIPGGTNADDFVIDSNDDAGSSIGLQFGNTINKVLSWDIGSGSFNFNDDVYVEGNASLEGNLFLDSDDTAGDVTIQFGNTLAEVIQWDSANSRFNISDNTYVDGTLEVNGNVDFNQNQADEMVFDNGTSFPGTPVEGQTFYRTDLNTFYIYDGSSWGGMADAAGSDVIFLSPVYPHATYYADGSNNTGQLTYYYDNVNVENVYRWSTSRVAAQDYDTVVRIQLPDNFSSWDITTPIEFKYRTDTTSTAQNKLDFTMLDTADASVTLSNNTDLASSVAGTWVTSTNMGITGGTWTAGEWVTVTIKTTATNAGGAEIGSLVLNYNI